MKNMNKMQCDILNIIKDNSDISQRMISKLSCYSLGNVNNIINDLYREGFIDSDNIVTNKGIKLFNINKPKRAIILAAGYGMRMVPINMKVPKGILKVHDECLIDRIIKQLHEVGIYEIHIVVGYLKEKYEYLIDKYNVDLIVNSEYSTKGSIYSLKLASKYIDNSYIIPCNIWCKNNPFNVNEINSWYMVNNDTDINTDVRVNRKYELIKISDEEIGNKMIGIAYLNHDDSIILRDRLSSIIIKDNDACWENVLYDKDRMFIYARVVDKDDILSINTYEDLRDIDSNSNDLESYAIDVIKGALNVNGNNIKDIRVLKKGMTNRSFMFSVNDSKYIMRIPGEGTEELINRKEEASVYCVIGNRNICDDIVYINENNGYKITKYIDNARVCNPFDIDDVKKCINFLKRFHNMKLKVNHEFDIFGKIDYYENLWNGNKSIYEDYDTTKKNVLSLKKYIDENVNEKYLTHIDAVPDNFLISNNNDIEEIHLIDWEYAGMQDVHVDIAMFAIYALYNKTEVDRLIDIYFDSNCDLLTRIKIYCYISCCGLLWSNWCEYKRNLGIEFGEYSLKQYRFAKDYYNYAIEEMKNLK